MNAAKTAKEMIKAYRSDGKDCVNEDGYISIYYGNIISIQPSEKYYMPWTTNQTDEDVNKDREFWNEIDYLLGKEGLWVESGEGDALDIFICGDIE